MNILSNLSVLPFYESLAEQQANKWWVNGKIYPLYSKRGEVVPSQIIREHTGGYHRGEEIEDIGVEIGYIDGHTGDIIHNDQCYTARYDVDGLGIVFVVNAPKSFGGGISVAFFNSDNEFIGGSIEFEEQYTGIIEVPTDATTMLLLVENDVDNPDVRGVLYTAIYDELSPVTSIHFVDANTHQIVYNVPETAINQITRITHYADLNVDVIQILRGIVWGAMPEGRYYLEISDDAHKWYSDVFTSVSDVTSYLQIEWWDDDDLPLDEGIVCYANDFRNTLYLCSDIAKPDYIFNEEVEERDGYTYYIKQISEKRFKFAFWSPEYLLDVIRLIRLSDHIRITYKGKVYDKIDSFLITPEWESEGDIAKVSAEFTTATICKKNAKYVEL